MKSTPLYPFTYEAYLDRNHGYFNGVKQEPTYAEYIKFELENEQC